MTQKTQKVTTFEDIERQCDIEGRKSNSKKKKTVSASLPKVPTLFLVFLLFLWNFTKTKKECTLLLFLTRLLNNMQMSIKQDGENEYINKESCISYLPKLQQLKIFSFNHFIFTRSSPYSLIFLPHRVITNVVISEYRSESFFNGWRKANIWW